MTVGIFTAPEGYVRIGYMLFIPNELALDPANGDGLRAKAMLDQALGQAEAKPGGKSAIRVISHAVQIARVA
jgi:hypothetical protein